MLLTTAEVSHKSQPGIQTVGETLYSPRHYILDFSRHKALMSIYNKFPQYSIKAGKLDTLSNHPIHDNHCRHIS